MMRCVSTHVAELDLRGNVLTKLPDSVAEMKHLTCINLANNSFSVFPDKLTEIATLERINLEGNSITGNDNIGRNRLCVIFTGLNLSFNGLFSRHFPQNYQWKNCLRCRH